MRVGTYNIRYDNHNDSEKGWGWQERKGDVIKQIRQMDADVFGIDEALPHQKNDLLSELPEYGFSGVARDDGINSGEYNLIAYRRDTFDLVSSGHEWISETPKKPSFYADAGCRRVIVWAILADKRTKQEFVTIVTHLDNTSIAARLFGVDQINQLLTQAEFLGLPQLVVGDFNMVDDDEAYQQMVTVMKDCTLDRDGHTIVPGTFQQDSEFMPSNPQKFTRIDYIFSNQFVAVKGVTSGQLIARNGWYPSDHFPIWAEVSFTD